MIFLFILFVMFTGYVLSDTISKLLFKFKSKMGDDLDFSLSAMSWTTFALSLSLLTWFLLGFGFYTTVMYFL